LVDAMRSAPRRDCVGLEAVTGSRPTQSRERRAGQARLELERYGSYRKEQELRKCSAVSAAATGDPGPCVQRLLKSAAAAGMFGLRVQRLLKSASATKMLNPYDSGYRK
ncbi:MAG: hypothetical protein GX875_00420, partial [Propionibacterium sp.]|nr:hypothetical protein [Propionibacterium sp.]